MTDAQQVAENIDLNEELIKVKGYIQESKYHIPWWSWMQRVAVFLLILCPYRATKTNNLMYDAGYSWCEAHYLNPIAITYFRITASYPNDPNTSVISKVRDSLL